MEDQTSVIDESRRGLCQISRSVLSGGSGLLSNVLCTEKKRSRNKVKVRSCAGNVYEPVFVRPSYAAIPTTIRGDGLQSICYRKQARGLPGFVFVGKKNSGDGGEGMFRRSGACLESTRFGMKRELRTNLRLFCFPKARS